MNNEDARKFHPKEKVSLLDHSAIQAIKTLYYELSGKELKVEIPRGNSHLIQLPLADGNLSMSEPDRIERAGLARQFPGRKGEQRIAGTRVLSVNSWCEIVRSVEVRAIPLVLLRSGPFSLFKTWEASETEVISGPGDFQMVFEHEVETLSSLMESLARWLEFELEHGSEPLEQHLGTAVSRACAFIAKKRHEVLTVQQVSDHVGLSRGHFSALFKQELGQTFLEFLSRSRVTESCRLIEEGHLRMNEIAFKVGFKSVSQFNRNFLAYTGKSPSAYREAFWSDLVPLKEY